MTMDRDEAVTEIQNTLGFRTDKAAEIVLALQRAQTKLEKGAVLPWFLQTEVASETTTKDEERVAIPSDFLREWEDDPLWYFVAGTGGDDDTWTELAKEDLAFARDKYPGSGAPVVYVLDVSYFRIFPTPDAVYTLKMIYYKTDTLLTTNVTNLWLTHLPYLMVGEAGRLFVPGLRDKDAQKQFLEWAAEGRREMLVENEARMNSSRRFVMGGND